MRLFDPTPEATRMRAVSGNVKSSDPLVVLLYTLARNCVPTGMVDGALNDVAGILEDGTMDEIVYCNGWLARWAEDAAVRLREVLGTPQTPRVRFRVNGDLVDLEDWVLKESRVTPLDALLIGRMPAGQSLRLFPNDPVTVACEVDIE